MKTKKLRILEIREYGLMVETVDRKVGLVHISNVAHFFVKDLTVYFKVNDVVYGKVVRDSPLSFSLKDNNDSRRFGQLNREIIGGFNILEYHLENVWIKDKKE